MGLQSQLNDVSSDSIPIFLLTLIATFVTQIRSLVYSIVLSLGFASSNANESASSDTHSVSKLVASQDQDAEEEDDDDDDIDQEKEKCVFCLSGLKDSECISKLTSCRHVFHKDCLDGWVNQMKFSCPLCRSPLVSEWRVSRFHRRVVSHLTDRFAVR